MEELGIGRPSTYASILQVLQDRDYVRIDKKRLIPEDKGRVVIAFLESFFARYVEYDFTAELEEKLDRSRTARSTGRRCCAISGRDFIGAVNDIKDLRITPGARRAQRPARAAHLPGARRRRRPAPVPDMRHRQAVAQARHVRRLHRLLELSGMQLHPADDARRRRRSSATKVLGKDPGDRPRGHAARRPLRHPICSSASRSSRRSRRRARTEGRAEKPKRASLPKGVAPDDIDLEKALALLSLPREVGKSPGRRRADPGRHRPLRSLRAARQDLRQSRGRRRRAHRRPQPRGHADRREERQSEQGPPLRRRSRQARSASIPTRAGRSWSRTAATALTSATTASTPRITGDKTPETITLDRGGRAARCARRSVEFAAAPRRRPQGQGAARPDAPKAAARTARATKAKAAGESRARSRARRTRRQGHRRRIGLA